MYGRTSICQKSGSEDSSTWLYWSLWRKSHSKNLKNTSCTALASEQMDRCVPIWLKTNCLQKLLMWFLHEWGATRDAAPPCITPRPSATSSASTSPLVLHLGANLPSEQAGALHMQEEKEVVMVVTAGERGTRTWGVHRFLLFSEKGDLKGPDPPRLISKTCNLHMTFSAIVSTE